VNCSSLQMSLFDSGFRSQVSSLVHHVGYFSRMVLFAEPDCGFGGDGRGPSVRSVVVGFVAGLLVVLALQAVLLLVFPRNLDRWILALVANPAIFVMLAYCFYNFINLGHASIRIRIFKECDDRGGFITREELRAVYDDELIKEARLQRLLEGGDVVRENGRWKLVNPRLVPVAKMVFGLKKFVLRRESEFDSAP
jgi:hypothetical protein